MKNLIGILVVLSFAAAAAFADIRPPVRQSTPAPAASPATSSEVGVSLSVSRFDKEGTLVVTKSLIEKINAAAKAKGQTSLIEVESDRGSIASTQTIVGGVFLSLAFVLGGVWLARSKGQVSKPALGIMLLAMTGLGTTLVIGNVPPPKRIKLDSGIVNGAKMNDSVAVGKMKLLLVDYESKEDVMIVLGNNEGAAGEE
jgi:hypothetical protein